LGSSISFPSGLFCLICICVCFCASAKLFTFGLNFVDWVLDWICLSFFYFLFFLTNNIFVRSGVFHRSRISIVLGNFFPRHRRTPPHQRGGRRQTGQTRELKKSSAEHDQDSHANPHPPQDQEPTHPIHHLTVPRNRSTALRKAGCTW
jgi:hypothetical protein